MPKRRTIAWDTGQPTLRPGSNLIATYRGAADNVQRMVDEGTMGNLRTLNPPLSPMLWTSIATGKRPFKHGIYGFTEPNVNNDGVQPMTNLSRSCKAIWNILNQQDQKSLVVAKSPG